MNRVFEFVVNGEVVDTLEAKNKKDLQLYLVLKEYCEKKGGIVREVEYDGETIYYKLV